MAVRSKGIPDRVVELCLSFLKKGVPPTRMAVLERTEA